MSFFFLLVSVVALAAGKPCNETSDVVGSYTACREPRSVRDAVFRYNAATCDPSEPGARPLPLNRLDLPCNISCAAGFFLPIGATTCEGCAQGSASLGGGLLVSHWTAWPNHPAVQFSTRCEDNDNEPYAPGPTKVCAGWQLGQWHVRSGAVDDYETSVLEARFTLVRPGRVSFDYYVSSENRFDGLVFLVDNADRRIGAAQAALPLVSNTPQLANFSVELAAGYHTLTWRYFKDFLTADGDDLAYIKHLEISGLAFADDACTLCPAGTFAAGRQQSRCQLCAANTKAEARGSRFCVPCDPDAEFSRPGATTCLTRVPCAERDYHVLRTLCQADAAYEGGRSRRETYEWLEPKICNSIVNTSVPLPLPRAVPCLPCNGGYRRSDSVLACTACAGGTAGGGATNAPCVACGNGEAAVRRLIVDPALGSFPPGMTTSCTGACATNGWRLTDAGVDSGVGHGADAQPTLVWDVDVPSLNPPPYIEFLTTIDCGGFFLFNGDSCDLEFTITGGDVVHPTTTISTYAYRRLSRVYFLAPGRRTLTWTFSKEVEAIDNEQQRYFALLANITLVGATLGGAPACVKCAAGSIAATGADSCLPCPAGTGPNVELTACEQCPGNQVAPVAGRGCRPCGPGTRRETPVSCDDGGCQFRADNFRTYDFSPLRQSRPYELAVGSYTYELWVCRNTNRSTAFVSKCGGAEPPSPSSLACQARGNSSFSIGDEVSFYSTRVRNAETNTTETGVTLRYTGGRACTNLGIDRSVNITLLCDMDERKGAPVPCAVGGAEPRTCQYCFEWRSQYGCPVCGADDREQVFSECRLGLRRAQWKWRNERRCWGGTLPPASSVPCEPSSLSCPAGQKLPPGASECERCPNGTFSLGSGTEYFSFEQTDDVFKPTPTVNRWTVRGASMHSGDGTSEMTLTASYVATGSLDFGYVLLGDQGTLTLLINGEPALSVRSGATPSRFTRDGLRGDVTFTWRFENGNATLLELPLLQKAIVYDVRTLGTEYASPDCDDCPAGTVPAFGNSQCRPCFNNTIATNDDGERVAAGATTCTPCKDDEYTIFGTNICRPRDATCDTEGVHYDAYFTPCVGGRRTKYYQLLRRCVDTSAFDALENVTEPCAAARVCRATEFLNEATGNCTAVPAGHVPVRSRRYLSALATHESSPLELVQARGGPGSGALANARAITGCVAIGHARSMCGGGWRLRGSFAADSGDHGDEWTDSLLVLRAANDTFAVTDAPGSLKFDATFVDPGAPVGQLESTAALTALYVYYGNDLLATITKRDTYELPLAVRPLAEQNITFRYHQWTLENRTRACVIGNITIQSAVGTATGSRPCAEGLAPSIADATCVPCPAGTSSARGGACVPCAGNTFAPTPGSKCLPCGVGAVAARPPTRCFTSCLFSYLNAKKQNRTVDLRPLFDINDSHDLLIVSGHSDSVFELSPCGAAASCGDESNVFVVERMRNNAKSCIVGGSHVNFTTTEGGYNLDYTRFGVPKSECPDGKRVSRISFICSPDSAWDAPQFVESLAKNGEPDRCAATFVWVTPFGCPVCISDDYTLERTQCVDNERNATLVRRGDSVCNGPLLITDTAKAKALKQYADEPLGTVLCEESYEFPIWTLIVAAVVVGCVVLTIFGLVVSNRRVRQAYLKLREQAFSE